MAEASHLLEEIPYFHRHTADIVPLDARPRIEIDAQLDGQVNLAKL